jgi:predicted nucleic acid-binding protein
MLWIEKMRKTKLYLDTSVISHLDAPDTPEKMEDTLRLWGLIQDGEYSVALSEVVFGELAKCPEPKKTVLDTFLTKIDYERLEPDSGEASLASKFIELGVLRDISCKSKIYVILR